MTRRTLELQGPLPADEPFRGILTGIANHEAKIAVMAIIASQPDQWFSEADLWHEVVDRQGEHPGWVPDRKVPIKYCVNSLAPVGLVAKGSVASVRGETTAFKANDDKSEIVALGYALSGASQEWSLDFPDLSLQKALGVTASKGAYRTPLARYKIFQKLVERPSDSESYFSIATAVTDEDVDAHNIYSNIRDLARNGILETHVKDVASDITLEIIDPEFYHKGLELEDLRHETQVVYSVMQRLWSAGRREISFTDMVDQAWLLDPSLDANYFRKAWHYGGSEKSANLPGLRIASRHFSSPEQQTSVGLAPEHAEAIGELVTRFGAVATGSPDVLAAYRERARLIISDPSATAKLFAKARTFSSCAAAREEGAKAVEGDILAFLKASPDKSIMEVRAHLAAGCKKLTKAAVDNYLRTMAKQGRLIVDKRRADPTKKRRILFFSVAEDN